MATRTDIEGYKAGEALEIQATLTDDDGAVTSGTVMLYIASRPGLSAEISVQLSGGSGGVWTGTVPAATMATLDAPSKAWYEIWLDETDRAFLEGELLVGMSVRP